MVELFTRWGRVGDDGQTQVKGPFNQMAGIAAFKKQFTAKTGVSWALKEGMQPASGMLFGFGSLRSVIYYY
jgi:poly [ADP-ribose] polymerase